MMFDFALCLFGVSLALGVCGFVTAFANVCAEEYITAAVAAVVMVLGVGMACGIGGAMWR